MNEQPDRQRPQLLSNGMLYLIIGTCAALGMGVVAMSDGDILGAFGQNRFGETASRYVSFVVGGAAGIVVGTIAASVIWHRKS